MGMKWWWAPILLSLCLFADLQAEQAAAPSTLKTRAAAKGQRIGAYYEFHRADATYRSVFEREFNAITVWPWADTDRVRERFDFSDADRLIEWASRRGMPVSGAHLIWFEDIPAWVKSMPAKQVEPAMNHLIDSVVGHFAGRIKVWNVVNETIDDDGHLRLQHKWAQAMGADYIAKAFRRAHAADPAAMLLLNEYGIEDNAPKYFAFKSLLKRLLSQGVPVHAVGWQMHLQPHAFDPATLLERMNEIADMGLDNYITELDVALPDPPSAAAFAKQKEAYRRAVEVFLKARRHKTLTVWGLRDGDPNSTSGKYALPFDTEFRKKPAYFGILEGLGH